MIAFKSLKQRGDTIAEVMVCLAVFGAMLTAAFALTNKNQATSLSAQERTQASKVAESQLEKLRAYADSDGLPDDDYFCMLPDGKPKNVPDKTNPPTECRTSDAINSGQQYSAVVYSPARATEIGGNGSTFAVLVNWQGFTDAPDEIKIFYAVYDTSNPAFAGPAGSEPLVASKACSNGLDDDTDGRADWNGATVSGVIMPKDPGCKDDPNGVDERDAVDISIVAAADCYAPGDPNNGCPDIKVQLIWSDGSIDTLFRAVTQAHSTIALGTFVKDTGVTLKRAVVNMTSDKYEGSPGRDRNVYVYSLIVGGTEHDYNKSSQTPCDTNSATRTGYGRSNHSRFLCGVEPTIFFFDGPVLAACANTYDDDADGLVDFGSDNGCTNAADNDERVACSDGIDNDADGRIDYPNDVGCADVLDNGEGNPAMQPLYRCYQWYTFTANPKHVTNNLYTLNRSACTSGNDLGRIGEGIGGDYGGITAYVPPAYTPGAIPVYGGFNGSNYFDDFYTTNYGEYTWARDALGWWQNANIRFWVYPLTPTGCQVPRTVPLNRWWNEYTGDHAYVTSAGEPFLGGHAWDGSGTYDYEETPIGCVYPAEDVSD